MQRKEKKFTALEHTLFHFEEKWLIRSEKWIRLKPGAVPTLFPGLPDYYQQNHTEVVFFCEPGFTAEALQTLKVKSDDARAQGKVIIAALMVEDISIKKQIEYDRKNVVGYVNMGTEITDKTISEASNAYRAELLKKCLVELNDVGVRVISCTFDGTSNTLTMAVKLGAVLVNAKSVYDITPLFYHPVTRCENNNKPTARQFKAAFKKLLCRTQEGSSSTGNVVPSSNISILHIFSASVEDNIEKPNANNGSEEFCLFA
ncbi:hypothetical protein PR048_005853 [Dryococelus australis]|uniref:Transposable element P transposase-like RNase H domain-containing protein n=1 Tax=Dryococelus australis TaxID=614101 RepID=A0ABQ9I9C6_9NEOP|nr:hypothetical protein PR048_005853 [Dryococelus australis]